MKYEKDIFELSKKQELLTWALSEGLCLNLKDSKFPQVGIPENYVCKIMVPRRSQRSIQDKLLRMLDPLAKKYARISGDYIGFHAGAYEALLNAYQHGNQRDDSKKIVLAHQFRPKGVDVFVQDEGGNLDPLFGLFVVQKRLRSGRLAKDFYEFARNFKTRRPREGNQGVGTHIIHAYFDDVYYYRGKNDGLIVHMRKKI